MDRRFRIIPVRNLNLACPWQILDPSMAKMINDYDDKEKKEK